MIDSKIKNMLEKATKRKTELAELQGEKKHIKRQMEECGCETIEDIQEAIEEEEKKQNKIQREMEKAVASLEADYNWS